MEKAKSMGMTTVGLTGEGGGKIKECADYLFMVPSRDTARVQEVHILLGHIYCQLIEAQLFPDEE
jgi:D-sedoheptulose 7-phosphate isomerase